MPLMMSRPFWKQFPRAVQAKHLYFFMNDIPGAVRSRLLERSRNKTHAVSVDVSVKQILKPACRKQYMLLLMIYIPPSESVSQGGAGEHQMNAMVILHICLHGIQICSRIPHVSQIYVLHTKHDGKLNSIVHVCGRFPYNCASSTNI